MPISPKQKEEIAWLSTRKLKFDNNSVGAIADMSLQMCVVEQFCEAFRGYYNIIVCVYDWRSDTTTTESRWSSQSFAKLIGNTNPRSGGTKLIETDYYLTKL